MGVLERFEPGHEPEGLQQVDPGGARAAAAPALADEAVQLALNDKTVGTLRLSLLQS